MPLKLKMTNKLVDVSGLVDAVKAAYPPSVALSSKEIEDALSSAINSKLGNQPNVYWMVKLADGTYMNIRGKKARLFTSKGAATQALYRKSRYPTFTGAKVVPAAMGEIKFELK